MDGLTKFGIYCDVELDLQIKYGESIDNGSLAAARRPYVSVKSKPKQPPGHLNFWKIFGKFPTPETEKLFKCPIIGPFQAIKCPHPRETFQ